MKITEVRIKLMDDPDDRLQAFCSITLDDSFVVRDLKIIEGSNGPFVAMPSRKLTSHCPRCGGKNHLRASYCNQCGSRLKDDLAVKDQEGRAKLYADIAHPINSTCREQIQEKVICEYRSELERAEQPGYVSRYDEGYEPDDGPPPRDNSDEASPTPAPASFTNPTAHRHVEPPSKEVPNPHVRGDAQKANAGSSGDDSSFGAGIF